MPIREAIPQDLLPIARIVAAAFRNESLFCYMHPYQDRYPDDINLFWLRTYRSNLVAGPDHHTLVSYKTSQDGDTQEETITGVAHWIRKRSVSRPRGIFQSMQQQLVGLYNYLEALFYPNRAVERSRLTMISELDRLTDRFYTGARTESWYLSLLSVDPTVQKTGHGRQLVAWGVEKAKEEGVSASLVSSAGNERFYRMCGFDVDLGRVAEIDDPDNPFRDQDIAGMTVLFKDP